MSIRQNNISGSIEQAAKHQRGLPLARAAALPPALRLAPHPIRAFGQPSLAAQPRHGHVPQLCRQPLFHRRCGHHAGVRVRWESAARTWPNMQALVDCGWELTHGRCTQRRAGRRRALTQAATRTSARTDRRPPSAGPSPSPPRRQLQQRHRCDNAAQREQSVASGRVHMGSSRSYHRSTAAPPPQDSGGWS